ncbi:MAG: nucleotidyl transferase AbiEii/AbiGii toxin family protein [Candidatus Marinimicrobia bacterium]|nr:nucleotidyl transferase AbiEii/AbiGii toxin family protein [Candidatus Neomarinimicrobiota bacterium]
MLTENDVRKLSKELRIDNERIVREYYEIQLLYEISKEPWSQYLIFKGGTALRLAYKSPRFSDDLDFALLKKLDINQFFRTMSIISKNLGIRINDKWEKRNTILCEFTIEQEYLSQNFRLKIEISKRETLQEQFILKILSSPVSPFQVLLNVATPEFIISEKLMALKERKEPRDLFDIWFLCQKFDIDIPRPISSKIDPIIIKQVLRKYLPINWYKSIDEIISEIG